MKWNERNRPILTDAFSRELSIYSSNVRGYTLTPEWYYESYYSFRNKNSIVSLQLTESGKMLVAVSKYKDISIFDFVEETFYEISVSEEDRENGDRSDCQSDSDSDSSSDEEGPVSKKRDYVLATAVSPDAKLAVLTKNRGLELWCLKKKKCIFRECNAVFVGKDKNDIGYIKLEFVDNGKKLAFYTRKQSCFWEIHQYDDIASLSPIKKITYERRQSKDGSIGIFCGQNSKNLLYVAPKKGAKDRFNADIYDFECESFHHKELEDIISFGGDALRKNMVFLSEPGEHTQVLSADQYTVLLHQDGDTSIKIKGYVEQKESWRGDVFLSGDSKWLFYFAPGTCQLLFWDMLKLDECHSQTGRVIDIPRTTSEWKVSLEKVIVHPSMNMIITHSNSKIFFWKLSAKPMTYYRQAW